MEAITEADGKLEYPVIRSKDEDIPRRIENSRANFAMFQVALDQFSYFGR
jgi:hypothetical protein